MNCPISSKISKTVLLKFNNRLHTLNQLAHINFDMSKFFFILLTALIMVALLFFPIYLKGDTHYDMNRKKFAFSVYGFGLIKLIGGYASTYKGGIALHVSSNKAILIPYSQMNTKRKKFSILKTFHLKSFDVTTETGAEYLLPIALSQALFRIYYMTRGGSREKYHNHLWITNGDVLRVSLNCTLYFNIFILLCDLFQFIKEKNK